MCWRCYGQGLEEKMTRGFVIFVALAFLVACGQDNTDSTTNATMKESTMVYSNISFAKGVTSLDENVRVETISRQDDNCFINYGRGQGWLKCDSLLLDQNVTVTVLETLPPPDLRPTPTKRIDNSGYCSASEYKSQATKQMNRLKAVMVGIDLEDKSAIAQDKTQVMAILKDINAMSCRRAFPLKQETLEYSARHFFNALKYAEAGELESMTESINKMELNVNAFDNWSLDMD
jgi:hypothetical protein